jgi:hypothetical protein
MLSQIAFYDEMLASLIGYMFTSNPSPLTHVYYQAGPCFGQLKSPWPPLLLDKNQMPLYTLSWLVVQVANPVDSPVSCPQALGD